MRRPPPTAALRIDLCKAQDAEIVHRLTQAAFGGLAALDPPSGADRETVAAVRRDLETHGGALARAGARPVGCLRFAAEHGHLHVRRVAVLPELQGKGIGRELMRWAENHAAAKGLPEVTVGVRLALPANLAFYKRLGYEVVAEHAHVGYDRPTWVSLRKSVPR